MVFDLDINTIPRSEHMQPVIVPNLDDVLHDPNRVRGLPTTAIAGLLIMCTAVQNTLAAALAAGAEVRDAAATRGEGDRLLTVVEAAKQLGTSRDWMYRHGAELPFALRLGGQLRFSAQGLQDYIRAKKTKLTI
jgi:excisionase family DNA binding protein